MNTPEETTVKRQHVSDIAFTPAVKAEQERRGSRESYARMEQRGGWHDWIDDGLRAFIAERDSFYLGTANSEGQPYIQHRGGPVALRSSTCFRPSYCFIAAGLARCSR